MAKSRAAAAVSPSGRGAQAAEPSALPVLQQIERARAEVAAAQAAIARSVDLLDLFVGPALEELNAAGECLARCARVANLRRMDPHRCAD